MSTLTEGKSVDELREELLVMDFSKIKECCRTCMAHGFIMSEIFDKGDLIQQIEYSTGLKLEKEDDLPTKMCAMCLKNLNYALKFKKSCTISYETFKTILTKRMIKSEIIDVDSNFDELCNYEFASDLNGIKLEDVEVPNIETEQVAKKRPRGRPRKIDVIRSATNDNGSLQKENSLLKVKDFKDKIRESSSSSERFPSEYIDPGPSSQEELFPVEKKLAKKKNRKYTFRKLYCDLCEIQFASKEESLQHRKDHDEESWVCEFCGKTFKHRSTHSSHLKSHMPPNYMCDQCDYKTWNKYDLIKHIRFHQGIKSFQCQYCSLAYVTSSNLADHIRRHHQRIKPFKCEICHHAFYDRTKLNRHLDSHNNVKRFVCEICKSAFTRRCYWKKHLLRHHGIQMPKERPGRKRHAVKMEQMALSGV